MFFGVFLRNLGEEQVIFMFIGDIVGFLIALSAASGRYRYIGGGWFEEASESIGFLKGLLVEFVVTIVGAGIGYIIGSIFA